MLHWLLAADAGGLPPWLYLAGLVISSGFGYTIFTAVEQRRKLEEERLKIEAERKKIGTEREKIVADTYDQVIDTVREQLAAMKDEVLAAKTEAAEAHSKQAATMLALSQAQAETARVIQAASEERHALSNEIAARDTRIALLEKQLKDLQVEFDTFRARVEQRTHGRRQYDPPQLGAPDTPEGA